MRRLPTANGSMPHTAATCSRAVMSRGSDSCSCVRLPKRSARPTVTSPARGAIAPVIVRSSVDLPMPLAPTSATRSPKSMRTLIGGSGSSTPPLLLVYSAESSEPREQNASKMQTVGDSTTPSSEITLTCGRSACSCATSSNSCLMACAVAFVLTSLMATAWPRHVPRNTMPNSPWPSSCSRCTSAASILSCGEMSTRVGATAELMVRDPLGFSTAAPSLVSW
mmetsp:Transcript_36775/g.90005  ORF Transcript_36775/g.90005 Transcript_36775/m.90005 type:complete len:223 (-) Transcript_36775:109-777(-)